jgi:DNA-binding protein H-NS
MSNVQMLLSQKMALERMIEQARVDELERNRRIEAEKFAIQIAEIAAVRESLQSLMKKYGLTEDQLLHGQVRVMNKSNSSMSVTPSKKLSLQEMRTFYSNL